MSSLLDKLKIKKTPKSKKEILVKIKKDDKSLGEIKKTIDKQKDLDVDKDLNDDDTVPVMKNTGINILDDDDDTPSEKELTKTEIEEQNKGTILEDTPASKTGEDYPKIINRTDIGFNREELKKRMREKGLIVPKIQIPTKTTEQKKSKSKTKLKPRKKLKIKSTIDVKTKDDTEDELDKIDLTSEKITKPKKSKRIPRRIKIRKKEPLDVIDESELDAVKYSKTITSLNERIPKEKKTEIIAPSYYMNNREKFTNFINSLFYPYKQEIYTNYSDDNISCESRSGGDFDIMIHQKIVRDYMNIHSPYRGLLLYHGLGSGKTCTSIAIAEGLKDDKQIVVMTPASLRANYISQLKFCGDIMFKKNQHWEFLPLQMENKQEMIKALSKALNITEKYIEKHKGAWFVNVKKSSNYDDLTTNEKNSLDEQLNKMISSKYHFINYNGLRTASVDKMSDDGRLNPFNNKVVIIDEAHNFISRIVNKLKKSDSISMRLYEFLLKAENCKIVLLSGTPIINYPNEIAILFNILRGYIKSWTIPLNIQTGRKINQETLRKLFKKYAFLDYIEYSPSSKKMTVTKNPFGFINSIKKTGEYKGVQNHPKGKITDSKFIEFIVKKLRDNDIDVIGTKFDVTFNKALPDDFNTFINYFIKPDGEMKNINLFKRRIIGLASYFRSAQEQLMPEYNENKDHHVFRIPMSDHQFGIYETARQAERNQEKRNTVRSKRKVGNDIYENSTSTYRIFSRAFCNFVFPDEKKRPMPKDEEDIEQLIGNKVDEDLLDKKGVYEMMDNPDGRYTMDDLDKLDKLNKKNNDSTYENRIKDALEYLQNNEDKFLVQEQLNKYSPKFLKLLEIIQQTDENDISKGLHLIYSQFRTLEGIGILKLVLEANGYAQFKIKQDSDTRKWIINIPEEDLDKPKFALYTGTETPEEKEIIRNIFNSTWKDVPVEITDELKQYSTDNKYGEIIQIIMITASGAEGINLRNVRHVHLIEPYWHPVRTEQVIGRARRICSHMDLKPEQKKVDVYTYLMTFTEEQKTGDRSIELRLKDTSKIDGKTPLTSDEALYEISRIKQDINRQLLNSVKETSIDCTLHSKSNKKEGIYCFSFGDVDSSLLSYNYSYQNEQSDETKDVNKKKVNLKAQELKFNGKKYMLLLDENGKRTDKIYDYDSFQQAKRNPSVNPLYIGKLVIEKDETGKRKGFIKFSET